MERSREYEDLAVALAEVRPTPRTDFERELDELVAAGFPRRTPFGRSPLPALTKRVRSLAPQRLLLATGGTALAAIAIVTVVVASVDTGPEPVALEHHAAKRSPSPRFFSDVTPQPPLQSKASSSASGHDSSGLQSSDAPPQPSAEEGSNAGYKRLGGAFAPTSRSLHRDIERSAEIGLLADPADVSSDSARVFSAVHDVHGIVLHSTTTSGKHAGASFDLLIPGTRLGDALAAFSAIDEVHVRHEATADVTAPTVSVSKELRYSKAWADRLQRQLSSTESELEREDIEAELHSVRHHATQLRAQLTRLHRRTTLSRVSLRIESSASQSSDGTWGIGDAFHDAGRILGIAAGVTLLGLAVAAPLALLCLLALLARRHWLRTRRERALDA